MICRVIATFILGVSSCLYASVIEAPDLFMQRTTEAVLAELKALPADDLVRVYALIDKDILPAVDMEYMSRWVAGRKAWSSAPSEQKKLFQVTFQKLMTKTYSSTLFLFKDRAMIYSRPPRVDYQKAKTIPVYCEIKQTNKESIQVIYQLRLINKQWKIFDVLVEGVSMIKGLQSQYEQVIAQKGLAGGIDAMNLKLNQQASTSEKSDK